MNDRMTARDRSPLPHATVEDAHIPSSPDAVLQQKELLTWSSARVYDGYEGGRHVTREANAIVTRAVMEQFVVPGQKILEVGSGIGELSRLVPKFASLIQQSDASIAGVARNLKEDPNSNIEVASAYSLPYQNGSFSNIVSYSTYDVLGDLSTAMSECARVLKPGGRFIHLLDLGASNNPIFDAYADSSKILFPYSERVDGFLTLVGMQAIERADYDHAKGVLHPTHIASSDRYASDPLGQFTMLHDHPKLRDVLPFMGKWIAELDVPREVINLNNHFKMRLQKASDVAGLITLESGEHTAEIVKERKSIQFDTEGNNLIDFNVGTLTIRLDKSAPILKDTIKVRSHLMVFVAEKPLG